MLKIVYLGNRSPVAALPLQALLVAGMRPAAVLLPARPLPGERVPPIVQLAAAQQALLPIAGQAPDLAELALQAQIPLFAVASINHGDSLALLRSLAPDVVCAVCFPRRLRPPLLALPRLGCLNVHPSLLPQYRGPAPIFWALRDGATSIGVTVHRMDATFDSGPIMRQELLTLPPGADGATIDVAWASLGGRLLQEALPGLADGTLQSVPQRGAASYQSWPTAADFRIEPNWSARRAFNFMRGTGDWNQPYLIELAGQRLLLRAALDLLPSKMAAPLLQHHGNSVLIRFSDGLLHASLG